MNNKHLSWYKEINNNFIIASMAYFLHTLTYRKDYDRSPILVGHQAPTRRKYDRTWVLGVANIRVCFMNGSLIEHDGLGIPYFSIDILKDMVACWYAWVLKSSCQN